MKQITLRDVPDEIAKLIEKKSRKDNLSLNKTIISLLERGAGVMSAKKSARPLYHDLDHLCGVWSKKEDKEFKNNLKRQRKIDEDLWKKTG